jgi:hypothetical protein
MVRKLGGVTRPKVTVVKRERKTQAVKKVFIGGKQPSAIRPSELKKPTVKKKTEFKQVPFDIALFQKQAAASIFDRPKTTQVVTTTQPIILGDIGKISVPQITKARRPARTIARQKGFRTIGEIRQARLGRRVDPFGRFQGTPRL